MVKLSTLWSATRELWRRRPFFPPGRAQGGSRRRRHGDPATQPRPSARYPGDYTGPLVAQYAPHPGTLPDPGEVVWAWVPFEEDPSQGKDRPALIIAREGRWLLGLPMTSKNHQMDRAQEASQGRHWVSIGSGPWDPSGHPSDVRVNRVVRIDPATVRRIGGRLDESRFQQVIGTAKQYR